MQKADVKSKAVKSLKGTEVAGSVGNVFWILGPRVHIKVSPSGLALIER